MTPSDASSNITADLENTIVQAWSFEKYLELSGGSDYAKAMVKEMKSAGAKNLTMYGGNCLNDTKGRFRKGEWIRTSYVVSGPDENGIIQTRNSVYRIVS